MYDADPFIVGQHDYNDGKRKDQNPYSKDNAYYVVWRAGWQAAANADAEYHAEKLAA